MPATGPLVRKARGKVLPSYSVSTGERSRFLGKNTSIKKGRGIRKNRARARDVMKWGCIGRERNSEILSHRSQKPTRKPAGRQQETAACEN